MKKYISKFEEINLDAKQFTKLRHELMLATNKIDDIGKTILKTLRLAGKKEILVATHTYDVRTLKDIENMIKNIDSISWKLDKLMQTLQADIKLGL